MTFTPKRPGGSGDRSPASAGIGPRTLGTPPSAASPRRATHDREPPGHATIQRARHNSPGLSRRSGRCRIRCCNTRGTRERDMRVRGFFGKEELQRRAAVVPSAVARSELVRHATTRKGARGARPPCRLSATVAARTRPSSWRTSRPSSATSCCGCTAIAGFEDLEDCYSQATLELVSRARTRARAFQGEAHVANALSSASFRASLIAAGR